MLETGLELTPRTLRVMSRAGDFAKAMGHKFIGTEHLILAVTAEDGGIGAKALIGLGIMYDVLKKEVDRIATKPG